VQLFNGKCELRHENDLVPSAMRQISTGDLILAVHVLLVEVLVQWLNRCLR
jgi:hypothetical protein